MKLGRRTGHTGLRQGWWIVRMLRGALPDRNPLRRTSDRVETFLLAALFVAAAAGAPFAAQAASHAAYAGALHAQQAQLAARHQVRAVLTERAGSAGNGYSLSTQVPVQATWTSVTGVHRTGQIMALMGTPKASTVTIWTDASGNLTSPPLQPSQVAGQRDLAAVGAIAGIGVLYMCEVAVVRRVMNNRRMRAWDADWEVTARTWNRQRW